MTFRYRAHGLDVVSDIELPLPPGGAADPDLVLRRGQRRSIHPTPPDGTPVATLTDADGTLRYGIARSATGVVLRYPGLCEFVGDQEFGEVTAHPHPGVADGYLPVLASGMVLALHLLLRGHLVLHASAVFDGEAAIAFVGASGMGKSTLATALCRDGCTLLADDVLRVEHDSSGMRTHPGSVETRLRPSAHRLADGVATRPTADGRLAVSFAEVTGDPVPLGLCVVPRPSRSVTEVSVERLAPAQGLLMLSRFPRVLGWCDSASMATTFQGLAELVERVPVVVATIPWGMRFDGVLPALRDVVATPVESAPVQR